MKEPVSRQGKINLSLLLQLQEEFLSSESASIQYWMGGYLFQNADEIHVTCWRGQTELSHKETSSLYRVTQLW